MSETQQIRRQAWRMTIRPGCIDEYIRRHDNIWPRLVEAMRERGVRTYSIFRDGHELFVYQEIAVGSDTQVESREDELIRARWQAYMKDVLIREIDPATGRPPPLDEIFHVE